MSKENSKQKVKFAPKMGVWVIVTPALGLLFVLLILFTDVHIKRTYQKLNVAMFDYSECNLAISNFREASEYLTNQVRFFVLNQDPLFMSSFMYETEDLDRRSTALRIVELSHVGDAVDENLSRAYKESVKLNDTEFYAMKLVCDATAVPLSEIPVQVKNMQLTDEDRKLTKAQKLQKAQDLVYDYSYLTSINRIMRFSAGAHNSIVEYYMQVQKNSDKIIHRLFLLQITLVILLLVTFVIFCILLLFAVIFPIKRNVQCIESGKRMSLSGAQEILTIAKAYNTLCDKNAVTASVLKHKAEHDPLTGLINRAAFENIKKAFTGIDEPLAYLMIDVDLFKQVNDKFGHLAGDDVLRKVSELLIDQFRNTDYVARIGGDEFAVIMTKMGENPEEVIERKIQCVNETLLNMTDGLPPVSLSAGAAIGSHGYTDDLIKKADEALYDVKKHGRCNCLIYKNN